MGIVINGEWSQNEPQIRNGGFKRQPSKLSGTIGRNVLDAIKSDPMRFHLIASLSCPWSHRALVMHRVKDLASTVQVQLASGHRNEGYPVNENRLWHLPGTDQNVVFVHEVYSAANPDYTGRASVPLLWDSVGQQVISNDSMELMKAFDALNLHGPDRAFTLYPKDLRDDIDNFNLQIFSGLANGVYRAGLARDQRHYEDATADVFETLDLLEARLSRGRLIFGRRLTLSDIVLFPVLVRFDAVYNTHFRCTRRRLVDYPNLWGYARDLYSWHGFSADVDFEAIRKGYFLNDGDHNPYRIISDMPDCDWGAPHQRATFGSPMVSDPGGIVRELSPKTMRPIQSEAKK